MAVFLSLSLPALAAGQSEPSSEAAPASKPPLSESLTGDARDAYDAAKLLFDDGDAVGAIAKFRHAYELSKDPRLLWNMAVCEKELRHYASAARLVTRYLSEAGDSLSAESRSNAQATQEALRGFYSELTLKNLPAGASVLIDGKSQGTAPLTGPIPIDLGRRVVRVELAGYEPYEQSLDVPGSKPVAIDVKLVRVSTTATVTITSTGADDVISIDGKVVGNGRYQGSLPAGQHVVRVTAPGKKPYETHIDLAPKSSRSLQVALDDEGGGKPIWPWIAGGAAVLVGAGIGGYFLFKPEDKPGSAPEGKLGSVYLPLRF
jgi:hypothetical protein